MSEHGPQRGGGQVQIIRRPSRAALARVRRGVPPNKLLDELGYAYDVRGTRLWARCPRPAHTEAEPSFTAVLDPDDTRYGYFHCFGCGFHGDAYDLLVLLGRHPTVYDAYAWVREVFGPGSDVATSSLYSTEWIDLVAGPKKAGMQLPDVYRSAPLERWPGRYRDYMVERRVQEWQTARHGLGWVSPKSVCDPAVCPCGRPKDNPVPCRFSDRIVFPVVTEGRLQDVQGRTPHPGRAPKMMTPRGAREPALFGHPYLSPDEDFVVIVEGPFDFLALEAAGYVNVVAILTSRVLPKHAELLAPWKRWVLLPDTDEGPKKNRRNEVMVETALRYRFEHEIYVATLPPGTDPAKEWQEHREGVLHAALEAPRREKKRAPKVLHRISY